MPCPFRVNGSQVRVLPRELRRNSLARNAMPEVRQRFPDGARRARAISSMLQHAPSRAPPARSEVRIIMASRKRGLPPPSIRQAS